MAYLKLYHIMNSDKKKKKKKKFNDKFLTNNIKLNNSARQWARNFTNKSFIDNNNIQNGPLFDSLSS